MKKLQPPFKVSAKQSLFGTGSSTSWGLANILHFTFEFSILQKVNLPYFFIIFHMIGVFFGAIFVMEVLHKTDSITVFLIQFIFLVFFLMSLMIFLQPLYTPFALFGAGFCIGIGSGSVHINTLRAFPELKDPAKWGAAGRLFSQGLGVSSILVIIYAIINLTENFVLTFIYFTLILIITLVSMLITKNDFQNITQEHVTTITILKNKKNLPKLGVAFFHGFFIINTYYAAILIFDSLGFIQYLNSYALILFTIVAIVSIPVGMIVDRIGRRITAMVGLALQALAFLVLSFLSDFNIPLIIIFISFLGIGFTFIYTGFTRLEVELSRGLNLRDELSISMGFVGIGAAVGVILGEVIKHLIIVTSNAAYLTIVLLFIFICATIVVFQVRETLPSRSDKFTKPDFIDDEDLTLYKERKICLVCKGKATGFEVYVCTDCGVLYCLKCAKALSNLENICWACNTPIDKSKPTKPLKGVEEEIKEEIIKDKFK